MSSMERCHTWKDFSYFDSPPLTPHIFMATMSGIAWNETAIFIQLIRPQYASKESIVIASHHCPLNSLPYRKENMVQFLTKKDPIINLIQHGDYFRFIKDGPFCVKDFEVHTRSIRNRPNTTVQEGDCNALRLLRVTLLALGMLQRKKESLANIIEMFKKQDEKEILKKQDEKSRNDIKRHRMAYLQYGPL